MGVTVHSNNTPAKLSGYFALAVGVTVILGWLFDIPALKSVFPGFVTMKANTAFGFILAGTALVMLADSTAAAWSRRLALVCAGAVALLGLLTLCQFIFGVDLGIDQLFFHEPVGTEGTLSPGRMAPMAAIDFLLLGFALLLAQLPRAIRPMQELALFVGLMGMVALMGYLYGANALIGIGQYTQVAVHAATLFIVMSIGILALYPSSGMMALVTGATHGGWLVKLLWPFAMVIPLLIGWLRIQGERSGYYESSLGVALMTIILILMQMALIWWSAQTMDEYEARHIQVNALMRASEVRYRRLFETAQDGVLILDANTGVIVDVNPYLTYMLGYTHDEMLGKQLWQIGAFTDIVASEAEFLELQQKEYVRYEHLPLETKHGSSVDVEFVSNVYEVNHEKVIQCNIRDITERVRAESHRVLAMQVLATLNRSNDITMLVKDILSLIKIATGIEAIGIRLREGEDYPYYETNGLSASFLETERSLCARDGAGEIIRNKCGEAQLECMCGSIICGHADAQLPLYTEHGSFWTNSTTEFLATTTEVERPSRMRNGCIIAGYESVALIPLSSGADIIGLLQLIDHRSGMFTKEMVKSLEEIGASIGIAVARKRMVDKVRESEARFRTLANSGQALIWTSGLDKACDYFNETWLQFTGRTLEQELGDGWVEGVHPEDLDRCINTYVTAFCAHEKFSMMYRLRHASGEYRWLQDDGTPRFDSTGIFLGYIGHCLDITASKRAEEEIHASRDLLHTIIESAPIRVFWKDAESHYLGCNSVFARDAGLSCPEELIGKDDSQLNWRDQAELYRADDQLVMDTNTPKLGFEEPQTTPDGHPIWLRTSKVPLCNAEGKVIGILGMYEDITNRIRAEEERENLQAQFAQAQKMESVGQLAAGVAHDFNNLLTGITGFTQFALNSVPEDSQVKEDMTEVLKLAKRAADLTHQLLAFSRRQPLQPVEIHINGLVSDLAKMLGRVLGEHLKLKFELGAPDDLVKIDPGQFEQVLVNLAVNARDAMPNGGALTIETANVTLDEEYTRVHSGMVPGPYVMLAVSDNGCGMDAETLSHMFEPFYTTKGVGQGTGLGLATVYGIIKQHGGNIWVYSEEGAGTTFKVYLPQVIEETELIPVVAPSVSYTGCETILVVEDDDGVREIVRRNLEALGYQVLSAALPTLAETMLEEQGDDIALLLTDIMMPESNGRQLYEALHPRYPHLRVLYMSGYTVNAILDHDLINSGAPFIQKPFTVEMLGKMVRFVLDG